MELRVRINRFAILKDLENKKHWNYLIQEGVLDYDDLDELKAKKKNKNKKSPSWTSFRVPESLRISPWYAIHK